MSMIQTIPYTYLIKCLPTNEFYYGVRWATGCSPDDLWKTYFTSSKKVKSRINVFGKENFEYEIRKTFEDVSKARLWEDKVLRRMKVITNATWLNSAYGTPIVNQTSLLGRKQIFVFKEDKFKYLPEKAANIAVSIGLAEYRLRPRDKDASRKTSESLKGRKKSLDHIQASKESRSKNLVKFKVFNNGDRNIHVKVGDLIPDGFKPGRLPHLTRHPSKYKGVSYEEQFGQERASKLKIEKSIKLKAADPAKASRGKTYEELIGDQRGKELRQIRSRAATKIYIIHQATNEIYRGIGIDNARSFLRENYDVDLYHYKKLKHLDIQVTSTRIDKLSD